MVVDPDGAGLEPAGDAVALLAVERPHRRGETEVRVVGEVNRLFLGLDFDDRNDRAEDLLAHDPHRVCHVREHGGRVERGLAVAVDIGGAAATELGAVCDRVVDELLDELVLLA